MSKATGKWPVSSFADQPVSIWQARRERAERFDLVVVGAGFVGLSTAYWAAKAGLATLVLDAGPVAGRASGRNAGFLLTGSAEPFLDFEQRVGAARALAFWRLSANNRDLVRAELIDTNAVECDFQSEGSWLASTEGGEDVLCRSAERLADLGFDLAWRSTDEARSAAHSDCVRGAIFQPRDGGLDSMRLCRGLAAHGDFHVRTGACVREIEVANDFLRLRADGGDVVAPRVVIATNAYVRHLCPELADQVRPVRAQMLATEPVSRFLEGVWYVNQGNEYIRQLRNGTLLVGGCRRVAVDQEVGYVESPTERVQSALEDFLYRTFPKAHGARVVRRWAGTMGFTTDGLPIVEPSSRFPGLWIAAGFHGHGMSTGFATGRWLAERLPGDGVERFPTSR